MTPIFSTCQSAKQAADEEWAGIGMEDGGRTCWAFGPESASQLVEPKEGADEICQHFLVSIFYVGDFAKPLVAVDLLVSFKSSLLDRPRLTAHHVFLRL